MCGLAFSIADSFSRKTAKKDQERRLTPFLDAGRGASWRFWTRNPFCKPTNKPFESTPPCKNRAQCKVNHPIFAHYSHKLKRCTKLLRFRHGTPRQLSSPASSSASLKHEMVKKCNGRGPKGETISTTLWPQHTRLHLKKSLRTSGT